MNRKGQHTAKLRLSIFYCTKAKDSGKRKTKKDLGKSSWVLVFDGRKERQVGVRLFYGHLSQRGEKLCPHVND